MRQRPDRGDDARDLVALPHHRRFGPSGFAADIDQRSARGQHCETRIRRLRRIVSKASAIGKAVGRHVQYAHDLRLIKAQHALAQLQRGVHARQVGELRLRALGLIGGKRVQRLGKTIDRHDLPRDEPAARIAFQRQQMAPDQAVPQPDRRALKGLRAFRQPHGAHIDARGAHHGSVASR